MPAWRLIVDGPVDGARNMALDHAMLSTHAAGDAPPTLRLYQWSRPTVSIGRFQKLEDVDLEYCAERGVAVCRRPTGGRGVLHDDEITYALVLGVRDGLPRGVKASYRMICGALAGAFARLGVPAVLTARERGERGAAACYLHATGADLSLGAAKLSGSAQVWERDSCLQHGSFVISRDVAREARVFRGDGSAARALADAATTIAEATGARPTHTEVRSAIVSALESAFGTTLIPGAVADEEARRAREIVGQHTL